MGVGELQIRKESGTDQRCQILSVKICLKVGCLSRYYSLKLKVTPFLPFPSKLVLKPFVL